MEMVNHLNPLWKICYTGKEQEKWKVNLMEKAPTTRQLQAQASKEKLRNIVFQMSKEKSLDEIRIKDICEEADMSVGNFYLYFPSKESALIYSYKTKDDDWATLGLEEIADPLLRLPDDHDPSVFHDGELTVFRYSALYFPA